MSVAQALLGAAARNPPALTRLSGERTAFNASIGAPARNKRSVVCARSASVTPGRGDSSKADPPPEIRANTAMPSSSRFNAEIARFVAVHSALIRNGMTGFVNAQSRRERCPGVALLGNDVPGDDDVA